MAQLLSLVCTDTIKFQNPLPSFCSRNHWSLLPKNNVSWSMIGHGGRRKRSGRVRYASQYSSVSEDFADDYYAVLGLPPDATPNQIKKAYYNCMKACHPDLSGDDPETTNFCMFINEVYAVLSDPVQRMIYDEIHGYALTAINPFLDDTAPKDQVFVDEFSCIEIILGGCLTNAFHVSPVDCIHWTSAQQLSLLEDEMRRVERVNVALMLAGMGSSADVFRMATSRWEKRQMKVLEQAKAMMTKERDSGKADTFWSNLWGKSKDYKKTEEEVIERAKRAAAAARRWREYSRKGADKPPTFKLPEAVSNTEK